MVMCGWRKTARDDLVEKVGGKGEKGAGKKGLHMWEAFASASLTTALKVARRINV